jgi:hypothetical protein
VDSSTAGIVAIAGCALALIALALLDARRHGVVLSSIHHREQARLYAKHIRDGEGELQLSPEEAEAVTQALAG